MRAAMRLASDRSGWGSLGMADPNPWDVIPAPLGDPIEDAVYQSVGMALTGWEFVEEALAEIFSLLVGDDNLYRNRSPAVLAYGAIIGSGSRVEMIEAAAKGYFVTSPNEGLQSRLKALLTRAGRFGARRNEIAHGRLQLTGELGWFLYPAFYNSKKNPAAGTPTYRYSAKEIHIYRERFEELYDDLSEFVSDLRASIMARKT